METTLGFEVTKRCNLQCPFCMRGEARNEDLSVKRIQEELDRIVKGMGINNMVLTGGEPSLVPLVISMIIKELKSRKICLGNVSLVSNGKVWTEEFKNVCIEIGEYAQRGMTIWVSRGDGYRGIEMPKVFSPVVQLREKLEPRNFNKGRARINGLGLVRYYFTTIEKEMIGDYWNIVCQEGNRLTCDYEYTEEVDDVVFLGNEMVSERKYKEIKEKLDGVRILKFRPYSEGSCNPSGALWWEVGDQEGEEIHYYFDEIKGVKWAVLSRFDCWVGPVTDKMMGM